MKKADKPDVEEGVEIRIFTHDLHILSLTIDNSSWCNQK